MNTPTPDLGPLEAKCYIQDDHIIIDYGKNITWLSLHAQDARAMAHTLLQKADELDRQLEAKA